MPIRNAMLTDLPALIEGASRIHGATRFKVFPFNAQKTADSLALILRQRTGRYAFFVAENSEKKIVGALIGVMEQQLFSDFAVASIMHVDVLPEARAGGHAVRLIRAFETWAKNRQAFEINFSTSSGVEVEKTGRFISKMGYIDVGRNFVKSSPVGDELGEEQ